jgi:hypothetical protein
MPAAVTSRPALRSLAAIVDLPVRVGAVARRAEARPEAFVAELASLVDSASLGSVADAEALLACALWLLDRGSSRVSELHAIARRDGHELVAVLLDEAPAHRGLAPGGRLPPLPIPETARVVRRLFGSGDYHRLIDGVRYDPMPSLPERPRATPADFSSLGPLEEDFAVWTWSYEPEPCAWIAMNPLAVRRAVTRLGQHHSPVTIGRLLDDVATRERDVIAIAARRPTTPAIVAQLTSRLRWMNLPSVRAALVANPCTPSRAALLLAVTCLPRLRGLVAVGNVHPRVRELAHLVEEARARQRPAG